MLRRLGSALVFVAGSVVGGLALAFLIVALRPELIRNVARVPPAVQPAAAQSTAAAPGRVSYADAVQRAAPAVVNIYTRRLVTERLAPSFGELVFGEYMPRTGSASSAVSARASSSMRTGTSSPITM